ncbi:MraY family glycosyltransferase [Streptomyces cavernicola]|uniref:MraY family glycosyltransferase n=1 Tax=Streptomyces cavernicola TaxID=3043613 RepID=A0ABT6SJ00_9ACTN|nr:MraY family glycosyltransferase [Streptomyces sp. B-S-A6]MDI3407859.1 MraY family glycosyltransferase [Streptomyces sp. B-S-A6]
MLYGIVASVVALLLTTVLTTCARLLGLRTGLVDRPGGRKTYARPTPHTGGLAVVAGAVTVMCTGYAPLGPGVAVLLAAAGAVALLGFVDDLRPLGVRPRLIVETGAAVAVVWASELTPAAGILAVSWIVLVTNSFNLIDNADGAMGVVGVVTALGLALCAAADGLTSLALLLCVLAAALTGFLTQNWHPARIFLGDCGSLFTGFVLACAAVLVHTGHEPLPGAVGLVSLTVVGLADTVLVALARRRAGRPLLIGGTDHIAHRLRRVGFTVPGAAVVLGATAFAGTLTGVLVHSGAWGPLAAGPLFLAVAAGVWALLRVRVYERPAAGTGAARRAPQVGRPRRPRPTGRRGGGRMAAARVVAARAAAVRVAGVRVAHPRSPRTASRRSRVAAVLARGQASATATGARTGGRPLQPQPPTPAPAPTPAPTPSTTQSRTRTGTRTRPRTAVPGART